MTLITVNVCADCYAAASNGIDSVESPEFEPLTAFKGERILAGCTEHDACEHPDCNGPTCECGYGDSGHGFSNWPCNGCESTFAGERFPLVLELAN